MRSFRRTSAAWLRRQEEFQVGAVWLCQHYDEDGLPAHPYVIRDDLCRNDEVVVEVYCSLACKAQYEAEIPADEEFSLVR